MTCILEKSPWWLRRKEGRVQKRYEEGSAKPGYGGWRRWGRPKRLPRGWILPDEATNGGRQDPSTKQRILTGGQGFGGAEVALHFGVESACYDTDASQANARAAQVGGITLGCCAKVLPRHPGLIPEAHAGS